MTHFTVHIQTEIKWLCPIIFNERVLQLQFRDYGSVYR